MSVILAYALLTAGYSPSYPVCRDDEQVLHWLCEYYKPAPLANPDEFAMCFTHEMQCHQAVRL